VALNRQQVRHYYFLLKSVFILHLLGSSVQVLKGAIASFKKWNRALLKIVNNCWNTEISFSLETSGGQKFILYLNVVHFFNTGVN
jgi:hypothetical protein